MLLQTGTEQKDEWKDNYINVTDGLMDRQPDRKMHGFINQCIDGWIIC